MTSSASTSVSPRSPGADRGPWGVRAQAAGGVAAQFAQAGSSFALQIVAVRLLGLEGLGVFAALYGLIILGTAVGSGVVGDSLTVLARRETRVRAALQVLWLVIPLSAGIAMGIGVSISGVGDQTLAVAAGAATVAFIAEDAVRRLLMASLRFWRIVVVDLTGLVVTLGVLGALSATGPLTVEHPFFALAAGQTVALVCAVALCPAAERRWVPCRRARLGSVLSYGGWRAVQVAVRPALLAGVRIGGLTLATAAAVGQLEAARIYLAPVLILVGGLSTVLMARQAMDRAEHAGEAIVSADRAARRITTAALTVLAVAVLGSPLLSPLITGGDFELPKVALVGWSMYAAALGFAAPYGTLAAVRCPQRAVVIVRLVEGVLASAVVALVLFSTEDVMWAPAGLAGCAVLGGVLLRRLLLHEARRDG